MITALEQRVLDAIRMDDLLQTLADLVAIRSLGGAETPAQEYVARWLQENGIVADVWELDLAQLRQHPAFGVEVERERALGVVGMLGEGSGRTLILNGHVDVVPAGDEANWRYPPWQATVADGRVYGRGTADMKGGVACMLHAAKAIRDAGVRLSGRLLIETVVGEEDGGIGTLAAVLRGYRGDGAIVVEPTALCIAPAQGGALNFQVTVIGQSAHGCVREEGVSAIEKFIPIHQALLALEAVRNRRVHNPLYARYRLPHALSIGQLEAGDWASSVPERCTFRGRYGVAPGEDVAAARQEFVAAVAQAAESDPWLRAHPPLVEWWGGQLEPASIPTDHPLVEMVTGALAATGTAPRLEGMTYGADMWLLAKEGQTPALLFGPGDVRRAHAPDEFVPLAHLEATVRALALAALRFCGAG